MEISKRYALQANAENIHRQIWVNKLQKTRKISFTQKVKKIIKTKYNVMNLLMDKPFMIQNIDLKTNLYTSGK